MNCKTLYHYTSNRGLVGIIEHRALHFSDVRFLNDSREFRHFCDMIEPSIRVRASNYRQSWIEHGCKESIFDAMVENLCARSRNEALFQRMSKFGHPFIFSLSEERDNLSQWRAYGNGEYCIGFDTDKLSELRGATLLKIHYSDLGGQVPLSGMIDWFFENHFKDIRPDGTVDPEVFYDGLDDMLSRSTPDSFLQHKDAAFSQEKEQRLVIYRHVRDEGMFFDPNGRYPTPRFKFMASERQNTILEAITEIICGPGMDLERSKAAIDLMGQRASGLRFNVTSSTVPYRSS